jgi:hypothetical protein
MNIIEKFNFVGESIEKAGGLASLKFDIALSKKVHQKAKKPILHEIFCCPYLGGRSI